MVSKYHKIIEYKLNIHRLLKIISWIFHIIPRIHPPIAGLTAPFFFLTKVLVSFCCLGRPSWSELPMAAAKPGAAERWIRWPWCFRVAQHLWVVIVERSVNPSFPEFWEYLKPLAPQFRLIRTQLFSFRRRLPFWSSKLPRRVVIRQLRTQMGGDSTFFKDPSTTIEHAVSYS